MDSGKKEVSKMATRSHNGFTLIELLVVITIIGVLIALVVPAVISSTESARRAKCINYQKELGLAVTGYTARKGYYPGYRKQPGNYSWVVAIFSDLDRKKLWEDWRAGTRTEVLLNQLICPGDEGAKLAAEDNTPLLSYVANIDIFIDLFGNKAPMIPSRIPSTTTTVMLGERYGEELHQRERPRKWTNTDAFQVGFSLPNQPTTVGDPRVFLSNHPGGSVVTFCDGHAKFLADTTIIDVDGTIPEQGE